MMDTKTLLDDLKLRTLRNKQVIQDLQQAASHLLNYKVINKAWSALECIEHLNYYGYFYLPEIRKCIEKSTSLKPRSNFKSSWLGNYFANSMLPKEKLNKMKTFKSMDPSGSNLSVETIETFLSQQNELLELIELAEGVDLAKTKTAISISRFIKLRLGDTFRVVVYHNERHVLQAARALDQAKKAEPVTQ